MITLYICNLPYAAEDQELRILLSQFGAVQNVRIAKDRETGNSRGFAFVEMEQRADGERAITALNDGKWSGRVLTVREAQNRPPQPREKARRYIA